MIKYISRKFIVTIVALLGGLYLVYDGKPIMELTAYMTVVLGFYQGSNVIENVQRMKQQSNKEKGTDGDSSAG